MQTAMTPKNIKVFKVHVATYRRSGKRYFHWSKAWGGGGHSYGEGKGFQVGIFGRALEMIVWKED